MTDSRRYLSSMPRLLPRSISLALLCAVAVLVPVASALADSAFYDGSSSDGKIAVFSTKEQMVPGDTDGELDVYVRAFDSAAGEYVTREVSIGPKGGNDTLPALYNGLSADGTKAFFSTAEPLVPGDTDSSRDVYLRNLAQNKTVLVSQGDDSCAGAGCGNGNVNSDFAPEGVAADGDTVFFTTTESLDDLDTDGSLDIYARRIAAEETVWVSAGDSSCAAGPCGNGPEGSSFRGIDQAGDRAVFRTAEVLSSQDADAEADIYERDLNAETTKLVSVAGPCPSAPCTPSYGGISPDGSHVFFETGEKLSGSDTDSVQDVYDWSSGTATLASIGTGGGNGTGIARYAETSADGKAVYFLTEESLEAADADSEQDVYRNLEGTTTLISAGEGGKGNGPFLASLDFVSQQGSPERAVFSTSEPLVAADADSNQDVYERSAGVTTLLSIGSEASGPSFNASFAGASADATKVFFVTVEHLVPQDTDNSADVYRRSASGIVLVSVGQINGNKELSASPQGVSADGAKAFFVTQERLTEGDNDAEQDVYGWSEGTTLLVSARNGITLGPPPPTLEKTLPASPGPSTTPTIVGQADSGSAIKIYKTANCSGLVVAQGSAEELASPGLTVTVEVALGSTTNYSATAEAEGIVSSCSGSIAYKQEDPLPPPPPGEEGGGSTGGGSTGGTGSTGGKTGSGGSGGTVKGGIVYVTPLPRITFGPASKTRLRRPTFRFVDSTEQPGTKFFCRVDKQRWSGCSSPIKVKKLKLGRHVFSLKAVNAVGTAGPSPVKRAFRVVGR